MDTQTISDIKGTREITPSRYTIHKLDTTLMRALLENLPQEDAVPIRESQAIMHVPMPGGGTEAFHVVAYRMMEEGLQEKHPSFRTVRGISVNHPGKRLRMDWTGRGFRAMVTDRSGRVFIDPVFRGNKMYYQSYHKSDFPESARFTCEVEDPGTGRAIPPGQRSGDCVFRSYRLAVATTGEYANFFGATSSADESIVLSEVVTAVNRVNDVYEADVTVRMILINETVDVFFYDGNTDPYTNGNGSTMLGQNISTCNDIIGSENYDIGHVFSTGGGGVAYLRVPCGSNKAGGVTGQNQPVNDPFYIDYVAHEMGHQFGANHTQNNSCNRNLNTSMEPGSASTIMGYAGICAPNVQSNSDAYFHGISVQEINNYISSGNGNTCDVPIDFMNSGPVVTPQGNYTIPASTPFVLTADAIDTDGDPLLYCWEQWDPEPGAMPPQSTNAEGPMFRTFFPEPSPARYFPRLQDLAANTDFDWEELPSVSRDMEFRVTIRDDVNGIGCTTEDNLVVTTDAAAGPFAVTSPNTNVTWLELQFVTIEWNVANTDQGAVSCTAVDILLSRDGGFTYPDTLASSVPNDGSHEVTIPPGTTTMGRVMVKCSSSIFFDISDEDITIEPGVPGYFFTSADTSQSICTEGTAAYSVDIGSIGGYTEPVDLAINFLPPNAGVTISPNPALPGSQVSVVLNNLQAVSEGSYLMEFEGSSVSGTKTIGFVLDKPSPPPSAILVSPADGEIDTDVNPLFSWGALSEADSYELQIDTGDTFTDPVILNIESADSVQSALDLDPFTTYFWRLRGMNTCHDGSWSQVYSFTTRNCYRIVSSDTPVEIPSGPQNKVYSYLQIPETGLITDLDVSVDIQHTWIGDLELRVTSPGGDTKLLVDQVCGSDDNMLITFDTEAQGTVIPCPPTDGNGYQPLQALTDYYNTAPTGSWELEVWDRSNQDGGTLQSWSIELCIETICQLNVDEKTGITAGTLSAALACAAEGDTILFDQGIAGDTIFLDSTHILEGALYLKNTHAQTVYITTEQPGRIFEITSGANIGLENVTLLGKGPAEGSAILNQGTLSLSGTHIRKVDESAIPVLLNLGQTQIKGNCNIEE